MRASPIVFLLLGPVLILACGKTAPPSNGASPDAAVDAAPALDGAPPNGTSGCDLSGIPTGLRDVTTTAAGVSRHYQVFVPDAYDASTPTSLVFIFHGIRGDGAQIRGYLGFEEQAAGRAIFVYPDGLPVAGGTGWAASDLAFFDVMTDELANEYCVDAARIFATGHSYGAYMANLVGCKRSDVIRAIAPVSGGMMPGACGGPVAAWIAHGLSDTTVGPGEGAAARDRWLQLNGCGATSRDTTPAPCVTYDGCSIGHPVTWCEFQGGHFPLPSFTRQGIWDFFDARGDRGR